MIEQRETILGLRNYEAVKLNLITIMHDKLTKGILEPNLQQDYWSASYYVHRKKTQFFILVLVFLECFKKATVSGMYLIDYVLGVLLGCGCAGPILMQIQLS